MAKNPDGYYSVEWELEKYLLQLPYCSGTSDKDYKSLESIRLKSMSLCDASENLCEMLVQRDGWETRIRRWAS